MSIDIMDPADQTDQPRRGTRPRKSVDKFQPTHGASKKRRLDQDDGDDESEESEESEEEAPRARRKKAGEQAPKAKANLKPKRAKATAQARGTGPAELPQGEVGIKDDCALFNSLLNPDIVLKSIVEDWVESYQGAAGDESAEKEAVHQIVLFFVRCCGLSVDIDEDEAMDVDGIADVVERIEEESAKTIAAVYPLISKAKPLRAFRKNLNLFLPHLIETLSLTPILYHTSKTTTHSTPLLPLLNTWLHSMSSSALRPLRHTSTYMSLRINSALCDVADGVNKDFTLKQRQREAEAKKKDAGNAAQRKERAKEADKKVKAAHEQKTHVEGLMQETVDVVCVHRVRDSDAAIRTDCFRELGVWIRTYPSLFGDDVYLGYLAKGCNDQDSHARLQTVKALSALYDNDSFAAAHRNTTHRLTSRLIEMAARDVDINVRVRALQTVTAIDKTGFLEDEEIAERAKVPKLLFDSDVRVRRAVGGFIEGMWAERVEALQTEWKGAVGNKKKRAKGIDAETMEGYLARKALAELLVETTALLGGTNENENEASGSDAPAKSGLGTLSRALATVEALRPHVDVLGDWEALGEYLLLDHSSSAEDAWLLDEQQESLMLQVFIACVKAHEVEDDEQTKTLMTILPRLIAKNQSDPARIGAVLVLVEAMKLDLYLDMRKVAAYESLWDDITKFFLTQSAPELLIPAISAISVLSQNAALATQNSKKIAELSEALFSSLRAALEDEDVAMLTMGEDQLAAVQAILLRICQLARSRDITDVMRDEEGGQTSGWDIAQAFVDRGQLGYKEEAKIVEYAIYIVFLHVTWRFKRFSAEDAEDVGKVDALKEVRDGAVEVFQRLALNERSNAAESVRRQAFVAFLNTHVLFSGRSSAPAAKAAKLSIADDVQHRLGGAFQAAIERFVSDLEDEDADGKQDKLEFYKQVASLVAAIRTGVLEVEHAREPLAHVGRLGATYDAIARKLVDVLRDEGIYNRQADTIQHISISALQSSFNAFLDTDTPEPSAPLVLTKLLASAFTIHGTHFSVLKQLHPDDAHDFHIAALDYICKKIGQYAQQERANKQKEVKQRLAAKRAQALTFFKCLVPLLGPVNGRDALRIRAHMGAELEKAGVEPAGTRAWEGYRAFEKRLVVIASRDENVKSASQRVVKGGAKRRAVEADAEGDGMTERTETSLSPPPEDTVRGSTPKAKQAAASSRGQRKGVNGVNGGPALRRQASSARVVPGEQDEQGEDGGMDVDEEMEETEEADEDEEQEQEGEDEDEDEAGGDDTLLGAGAGAGAIDLDLDIGLELDLDADADFASAAFPVASQAMTARARSVSVEPGAKRKRKNREL